MKQGEHTKFCKIRKKKKNFKVLIFYFRQLSTRSQCHGFSFAVYLLRETHFKKLTEISHTRLTLDFLKKTLSLLLLTTSLKVAKDYHPVKSPALIICAKKCYSPYDFTL